MPWELCPCGKAAGGGCSSPGKGSGGVEGLWLPDGAESKTSWRAEVEEGSRAGMEEACASGEGVGVSAAGAALPEGIQAPAPLGKLGKSSSGNIQFVQPQ